MDDFKIGDLVQYKAPDVQIRKYMKSLNGKVGMVGEIRNHTKIAYIKWSDKDANDTWVPYKDMTLLYRE